MMPTIRCWVCSAKGDTKDIGKWGVGFFRTCFVGAYYLCPTCERRFKRKRITPKTRKLKPGP